MANHRCECEKCGRKFKDLSNLRSHDNFEHRPDKVAIYCQWCDAVFLKFKSYQNHCDKKAKTCKKHKKIKGDESTRIQAETPVSITVWRKIVERNLQERGESRSEWMRFEVSKLLRRVNYRRFLKNGKNREYFHKSTQNSIFVSLKNHFLQQRRLDRSCVA